MDKGTYAFIEGRKLPFRGRFGKRCDPKIPTVRFPFAVKIAFVDWECSAKSRLRLWLQFDVEDGCGCHVIYCGRGSLKTYTMHHAVVMQ